MRTINFSWCFSQENEKEENLHTHKMPQVLKVCLALECLYLLEDSKVLVSF